MNESAGGPQAGALARFVSELAALRARSGMVSAQEVSTWIQLRKNQNVSPSTIGDWFKPEPTIPRKNEKFLLAVECLYVQISEQWTRESRAHWERLRAGADAERRAGHALAEPADDSSPGQESPEVSSAQAERRALAAQRRTSVPRRMRDARARLRQLRFGGEVRGTVTGIDSDGIHLVSESGISGFIPPYEVDATRHADMRGRITPGTQLITCFLKMADSDTAVLSLRRYRCEQQWPALVTQHAERNIVRGRVIHTDSNGLHLAVQEHLRGFIPWNHALLYDKDTQPAIGDVVCARLRRLNRQRHSVLLTRSHILDLEPASRKANDWGQSYDDEVDQACQRWQAQLGDGAKFPGRSARTRISFERLCSFFPMFPPAEIRVLCIALTGIVQPGGYGPPGRYPGTQLLLEDSIRTVEVEDLHEMLVRLERARRRLIGQLA